MFRLNIVNDNIALAFMSTSKLNDSILWHARLGHVHFKRMQDMSKDGLILAFDMDTENDLYDLHATSSLENKKYFVTFIDDASRSCYVYLLHTKDEALDKFKVFKTKVELQQESPIKKFRTDRGEFGVVRLPDLKLKTLGEKDIECIFVGYHEHFKAFRFYDIEPNDSVSINSIIESRDAIFNENKFSSVSRSSLSIPKGTKNISGSVVPEEVTDETPSWATTLECWLIYLLVVNRSSKKLKVDGTIRKFKARLVIQGFKQKSGIDYFDTYAPVARISTMRLLIAMASIHNMIIHQMDVKTAFLNGELDEEVYMNQPQSFIIPSNENKVCKLIKSLSGLKQTPKQWHQKFDVVVLSNGYLLNQADKYVYSKFNESSKEVIICLYVDDMLIFGTDQVQVDLAKEFLSSRFYMKDMREAHVILGIRIKYESNRIEISQSHFIEKVFNYFDCTPVSTPMDTSEKLMPNSGQTLSQLEYSRVIGCLMYVMTCTRLGIAFVVGKLSNYTSNPEGYTDASWISNTEDNSSTSGWVFLLADSKEAEWLKNLLLKISLWSKPIAPISIRCDSAAILAKAYSQMYNGKSRHLGIRHCMIHELITNGVISIEFVRSQQNLADYLTKRLARDLVIKSTEGM
ncbi:zinc finger, CCHC-type containing protein [Tanacetum coccineum]|uniref:Zinc finger, CCHC-type containing protein n=1 Tax=Tanacetum coccineum TaxID=301880 RepID=A0ABQ5GF08_9ASTR